MEWNIDKYVEFSQMQFHIGELAIQKLNPKQGESILDLGCGIGNLTAKIAKRIDPGRIIGIDPDKNMIEAAEERIENFKIPNMQVQQISGTKMNYDRRFDGVFSNIVIHWIKDQHRLFSNLNKSLKENGRMLIATIYTDPDVTIEASVKEDAPVKISHIEMQIMQDFVRKQMFSGILSMEEFMKYQPNVNKEIVYRTYEVPEIRDIISKAGFKDISIETEQFHNTFDDANKYLDYRSSNLWIYFLAYFPEKHRTAIAKRLKELILKRWKNVPDEKKVLPFEENWPVAFIQAKK